MPFGKAHTLHVEFAEKYDLLAKATDAEKAELMNDPHFAAYAKLRDAQNAAQQAQNDFAAMTAAAPVAPVKNTKGKAKK